MLGIMLQSLTFCELEQITRGIVGQGLQLASYGQRGGTPKEILVDRTSFLSAGRELVGPAFGIGEMERILAGTARVADQTESITCAPSGSGCEVKDDAMLVELLKYSRQSADRLTLEVVYHSTIRRSSGNTAVCALPMRLNFRRAAGSWRMDEAVPLRRC
jgi:hypothetical protein